MQRRLMGSVAVEELVANAVINASFMLEKNLNGEVLHTSHKINGRVMRPWKRVDPTTTRMYLLKT